MTPDTVVALMRQALEVGMLAGAPMLLAALATGLLISIFQAATSINEMTLTFIPKLVVMFVVMVLAGPWTIELLVDYTQRLLNNIPGIIGR